MKSCCLLRSLWKPKTYYFVTQILHKINHVQCGWLHLRNSIYVATLTNWMSFAEQLLLQIWSQDVLSLLSMPPLFPVLFVLGSPWNNARTAGANMFKKGKISLEYPHSFFNPELEIPDRSMFNLQLWVDFFSQAFNLQPCTIIQCSIPISIYIYTHIQTYKYVISCNITSF